MIDDAGVQEGDRLPTGPLNGFGRDAEEPQWTEAKRAFDERLVTLHERLVAQGVVESRSKARRRRAVTSTTTVCSVSAGTCAASGSTSKEHPSWPCASRRVARSDDSRGPRRRSVGRSGRARTTSDAHGPGRLFKSSASRSSTTADEDTAEDFDRARLGVGRKRGHADDGEVLQRLLLADILPPADAGVPQDQPADPTVGRRGDGGEAHATEADEVDGTVDGVARRGGTRP